MLITKLKMAVMAAVAVGLLGAGVAWAQQAGATAASPDADRLQALERKLDRVLEAVEHGAGQGTSPFHNPDQTKNVIYGETAQPNQPTFSAYYTPRADTPKKAGGASAGYHALPKRADTISADSASADSDRLGRAERRLDELERRIANLERRIGAAENTPK